MATLKDLRDERVRKLSLLREKGITPYPSVSRRTHHIGEVTAESDRLMGQTVTVAGRIVSIRKFGKLAFVVIRDASGSIQLFWKASEAAPDHADSQIGIEDISLLDSGDFVEATGPVIRTQTGELSVDISLVRMLAKSLRPLPPSREGFTDKEERLRRRYVDLNVNREVYDRFIRRSRFWQATRDFLISQQFIEINVPVLELTTGGADATPFMTHMDALDQDFYLRISHELPLKRLLVGGYEKVFDIGPRFRNENYSDEHLPEHVAMEWYWAYADWRQGMQLTQAMVRYIADHTWGARQFTLANGQQIDLGPDGTDWPSISFVTVIAERFGVDVLQPSLEHLQSVVKEHHIEVERGDSIPRLIDKLWKKIRGEITGPSFLVDVPLILQPLAKVQPGNPLLTEQFNLILGGTEACKAYSELNDPLDQLARFEEQQRLREAGDKEAMMMDYDFVEALEYAMPPACGYGHSERLFWLLEGVPAREGVPFPPMRPQ